MALDQAFVLSQKTKKAAPKDAAERLSRAASVVVAGQQGVLPLDPMR
jgi:hypothetical protein